MHIFYDSNLKEWRLIIGELPEKPELNFDNALYLYNKAIADLKQNALTVHPVDDKLYPWLGSYETKEKWECGVDNEQCMMNLKSKIYVDGGKEGDYIAQKIAFRREMEMNYSKNLDKLAELREALKEIIPIAEQFSDNYPVSATVLRVKQVIEKAKKLIP